MRPPEHARRVALRIAADEVHASAKAELVEQRLDRADEPPGYQQPRVGALRAERRQRPQRELEPVRLGLIATEEEDGPADGRRRRRREVRRVGRVVEDLPGPARCAQELVGGALRELALVHDVVGREDGPPQRVVQLVGPLARPARVRDAVLVDDDRRSAPLRDPQERTEVAREPRRAEVEQREVRRRAREALVQLLRLRRSPGGALARRRDVVVPVEHANAGPRAA